MRWGLSGRGHGATRYSGRKIPTYTILYAVDIGFMPILPSGLALWTAASAGGVLISDESKE